MAPKTAAKDKPGTERFRDEQREEEGGPRMHGREWHDHEEPREMERESLTAPDAVVEAEGSGDREGMGKGGVPRKTKGRSRQMQRSPRGKGVKRAGARGTGRGQRGASTDGEPRGTRSGGAGGKRAAKSRGGRNTGGTGTKRAGNKRGPGAKRGGGTARAAAGS